MSFKCWKLFHSYYFLQNFVTLTSGWRVHWEPLHKFTSMFSCIFNDVLKVEHKYFLQFCCFCLNYWQPLSSLPIILIKMVSNICPIWLPSTFNWFGQQWEEKPSLDIYQRSKKEYLQKAHSSKAVAQRCSVKKVFLETSQNSLEKTCQFCEISKSTFFYRTPPVAASDFFP